MNNLKLWQKKMYRRKLRLTSKQVGIRYGFRSGLEESIAKELKDNRVVYEFEKTKLKYTKPQKIHTYTPDFHLTKKKIFWE